MSTFINNFASLNEKDIIDKTFLLGKAKTREKITLIENEKNF